MATAAHILVVDDEAGIRTSLAKILEREAYSVTTTDSGEEALGIARDQHVDLVLADIMMPKMSGIDLLRALKAMSPAIEVVMMTAFGSVENAVECMREGAYDFIAKPLKRAIVLRSIERALERRALLHENRALRQAMSSSSTSDLVGQAVAWRKTLDVVTQAAPSKATILIVGESGTGKELLAREIHRLSDRSAAPFVPVNCSALPETLLESELFGHERGAFTGAHERREGRFERASGGTIFLDEIGETSAPVQVRLLRVLQEGEIERVGGQEVRRVDVRVVAATWRNLEEDVRAGRFREDLYYRLNVIKLAVPPLRERHGDVLLLAQHFLKAYADKNKKSVRAFAAAALKALDGYAWPGNVRELENAIERAVVLCRGEVIDLQDLPEAVAHAEGRPIESGDGIFVPFGTPLYEVERRLIEETLKRAGGDKRTAARLLGVHARTIHRKLGDREE
ncbi:MAG: sigma-54-dependent Fis family transcriptional regulator [Deltaproteobacteria bacterium]|nr:sigma-54-dependent Fis family transcriptional regulator [Deltaproteobacteria bacterium]